MFLENLCLEEKTKGKIKLKEQEQKIQIVQPMMTNSYSTNNNAVQNKQNNQKKYQRPSVKPGVSKSLIPSICPSKNYLNTKSTSTTTNDPKGEID